MLLAALLVLCPLVVSAWLKPATAGLGTHQQLGLPPCTVRMFWGVRCPSCGMTTSWAYLVRGQISESVRCNAGGTGLGLVAMAMVCVLISHAVAGRVPKRAWAVVLAWSLGVSLAIAMVDWGWRLTTYGWQ